MYITGNDLMLSLELCPRDTIELARNSSSVFVWIAHSGRLLHSAMDLRRQEEGVLANSLRYQWLMEAVSSSNSSIARILVVGWFNVYRVVLNLVSHYQAVYLAPVLQILPLQVVQHGGYRPWCVICVTVVHKPYYNSLYLLYVTDCLYLVR